jgi:hypothetical protein
MTDANGPLMIDYDAARRAMAHEAKPRANLAIEALKFMFVPGYSSYLIFKSARPAAKKCTITFTTKAGWQKTTQLT